MIFNPFFDFISISTMQDDMDGFIIIIFYN